MTELAPGVPFDEAQERFQSAPSETTALGLLLAGIDYWRAGMIGNGTIAREVLHPVAEFLESIQSDGETEAQAEASPEST